MTKYLIQFGVFFVCVVILASGCRTIRLHAPLQVGPSDWATEGSDVTRSNRATGILEPPLKRTWVYNAQAGFGRMSPLIVGDMVFIANRRGEVHVLNLPDGRRRGIGNFGEPIHGTPVIRGNRIYVANAWGRQVLRAYDTERGREVWSASGTPVEAGLLLVDEVLISADVEGAVRATDPENGEELWTYDEGLTSIRATPVVVSEGRVLVVTIEGDLRTMDLRSGEHVWRTSLEAPVMTTPSVHNGLVFISTTRGTLSAVNVEDGSIAWRHELDNPLVRLAAPAVTGSTVVVGGSDGVLRAFDQHSGALQWQFEAQGNFAAAPLISGDTVYAGSMDRHVYAIRLSDGTPLWKESVRGRIKSNLAYQRGHLIVLVEPRYVYAFTNDVSADELVLQ